MKRFFTAVLAALALAACQDGPTAVAPDDPYDMSRVTIARGAEDAARLGIKPVAQRRPAADGPRFSSGPWQPCYIDDPCCFDQCCYGGCEYAVFTWGSYIDTANDGYTKTAHLVAWSDKYSGISWMSTTGIFKSVGGSGPYGCNATPAEFERETKSGAGDPFLDHWTVYVERYASYPATATFVWQVDGQHTFYAEAGYTVDGYNRSGTYPSSSGKVCL